MRMLEAENKSGKIHVGDFIIDGAGLGAGTKDSKGVVLLDGTQIRYIASSALDIAALIESLAEIIGQVTTIATGLDAASTSPGGQAAPIAQLTLMKTELELMKDKLT